MGQRKEAVLVEGERKIGQKEIGGRRELCGDRREAASDGKSMRRPRAGLILL